MSSTLKDKVIMVTGGGSGIGRATCLILAREGAKVIVCDLNQTSGDETVQLVRAMGGEAQFALTDVSDETQVEAAVSQAVSAYGRLDGAFNNAGMPEKLSGLLACSEQTFDRLMSINVKGLWFCMRAQIKQMQKQDGTGSIVNTSSGAGLRGMAAMPVYSASKHAVVGLSKSVALEFATTGIRINAVCPGVVDTGMIDSVIGGNERVRKGFVASQPNGRMAAPSEIGEAVVWLLSDAASFVTGAAMPVDGGMVS